MQGHDILFDIENSRIGIAESTCDYNYLISGQRSEEFDPFNLDGDIRRFYSKNFCQSEICRSFVLKAFWISHLTLLIMYFVLRKHRYGKNGNGNNAGGVSGSGCGIKLKMSEEMEELIE